MTDHFEQGPLDGLAFTPPLGMIAVIILLQASDGEIAAHRYIKRGVRINEAGISDVLHQMAEGEEQ